MNIIMGQTQQPISGLEFVLCRLDIKNRVFFNMDLEALEYLKIIGADRVNLDEESFEFKAHTSRIHTSISLDIIGQLHLPHKKVCGAFGATIRNLTITNSKVTHFSSNVFACMDSMANIKIQNSNVTTGIGGST